MAAKKERIRKFLLDLTSLEVTTIVTEKITGEPMPAPHEAVAGLGAQYAAKLGSIAGGSGADRGAEKRALGGSVREAVASRAAAEPLDFEAQGRMAKALMAETPAEATGVDQGRLARIHAHSEHLERLRKKLGMGKDAQAESLRVADAVAGTGTAAELAPEDMVALRKMWELGTEPIALQTVIQAGGDLITRVHPDHAAGTQTVLLELHQTGIETAVGIWRTLVDTAVQILEKIFDR